MRVVLVHPQGSNFVAGRADATVVANRMVPQGLLSIAAWLVRAGHQVAVVDALGPRPPRDRRALVARILDDHPDLVGFSATTSSFLDAERTARALKDARPALTTVVGGVHASALGGELLRRFTGFDLVIRGEGEVALAELAAGQPPAAVGGVAWRDGEEVKEGPRLAQLPDLDALPFPAYELLDGFPRGYHLPPFSFIDAPGATTTTSRGCVFQCSYCDRSVFERSYRFNSAAYVYEHLAHLRRRFGVRHVNIYDDLFTANRKRIVELTGLLTAKPLGLRFNCAVRVGQTDDELLGLLAAAGCLMVSVGIESADPEMLLRHKAGVELDAVRDTVRRIQAAGLRVKGLFMMGLPGETEASIRATSDFILSLGLDDMNMSKFTPFPGAPIWSTIREEGTVDEDWEKMNCLNFVFVPKTIGSRERLDGLYNWHVRRFYSDPAWRRRLRRRLWQHRRTLWRMLVHLPGFLAARRAFVNR